ncbi:hypothetical protein DITRI_Ditri17bG0122000 [Diplodiscus trichospermus]
MVPEWQEAYMDYDYLKTLLKELQRFKHRIKPPATPGGGLKRKLTLYRAFSGLTQRHHNPTSPSSSPDIESQPILVEKFYREKVQEVMKEADVLNKQMDALIAFRIKVENPPGVNFDRSVEMTRLASDIAASAAALSAATPLGARSASKNVIHLEAIEESTHGQADDDNNDDDEKERNAPIQEAKPPKPKIKGIKPAPLEVLDRVKINNTLETPCSTIKGVLKVPNHTELRFNRENLRKVENQLKRAFVEFYQKLQQLKSYSFLNTFAFSKIMKKYDKTTSRSASKSYMKMVDNSYLGSSDEITKLMGRVENTFIKHFSNANRAKGMIILRPTPKRERHRTTFSTGRISVKTILGYDLFPPILFVRIHCSAHGNVCYQYILLEEVTLPDFFLADQLTSQVYVVVGAALNGLLTVSIQRRAYLNKNKSWKCLRRLFEEKDPVQGFNGLKYFLTIVAVCLRTAYEINEGIGWRIMAWVVSAIAAIFCTNWDFVYDWGLLNRHSKNRWLRDQVLVPRKRVYFLAMGLNVLLRFAWLQTVLNFKTPLHRQTLRTIVASLEIIRRGLWNFFRLENEHLNNVGKYRAFKSVPLPFNYDEDDDKDD